MGKSCKTCSVPECSKTLKTLEEALMWRNNTLDTLQGEYANLED